MESNGIVESVIIITLAIIVAMIVYVVIINSPSTPMNACTQDDFSKLERSVVTIEQYPIPFINVNSEVVDSNGYRYTILANVHKYEQYNGHNITFGYDCVNGRRTMIGVFMDDSKTFSAFGYNNETKHFMQCDYKIDLRWDVNKTCGDFSDS